MPPAFFLKSCFIFDVVIRRNNDYFEDSDILIGCEAVRASNSTTFILLNSTSNFVFRMEKHITFCEIGNKYFVLGGVWARSARCLDGLYNLQHASHSFFTQ